MPMTPQVPIFLPCTSAPWRVRGVLQEDQPLLAAPVGDVVHLARQTPGMHGDHGLGPSSQLPLASSRSKQAVVGSISTNTGT